MRRKKANKKEKEIKEEVIVEKTDNEEVLILTADEDNPIGDGKEFEDGDKHE